MNNKRLTEIIQYYENLSTNTEMPNQKENNDTQTIIENNDKTFKILIFSSKISSLSFLIRFTFSSNPLISGDNFLLKSTIITLISKKV